MRDKFIQDVVGKQVIVILSDGFDYQREYLMDSVESAKNFLIREIQKPLFLKKDDKHMNYLKTMGELSDSEDDIRLLNLAAKNLSDDCNVFSVRFEKVLRITKEQA